MIDASTPSRYARRPRVAERSLGLRLMLWSLVLASGSVLAALSIARYRAYNVGMLDLGNIAQAIASVNRGAPLVYTGPYGNTSRLASHAELLYYGLALLLRLWTDPRLLLVGQALLFASGAVPVYAMAVRRLPARSAFGFVVGYLVFPTAVSAVLFDVHGDTLALPLLLWMLSALDARQWRRFWLYLALSLACKFYIVAPVFALGLTLLSARTAPFDFARDPRRRRLGLAICAAAGLYGALMVLGVRPWFATPATAPNAGYASYYFGAIGSIGLLGMLDRLVNILAVLLPTGFLWWRGRWTAAPAFAIIVPALLSTGPGAAYAWSYHHYAAAVPFLVAGSIVGAARMVERTANPRLRRRDAAVVGLLFGGASLLFHVGLNDTPLGIAFWRSAPGFGLSAGGYGRTSRDALEDRWLAAVPPSAAVAASNFLAPHLFDRTTLFLVRYPDEPRAARFEANRAAVDLALPDALFDFVQQTGDGFVGGVAYDTDAIRQLLTAPEWGLVAAQDGLLRFARDAAPALRLAQQIAVVEDAAPATARFADTLELVSARVEPVAGRRYQATFHWRALRDFDAAEQLVAVSRLDGVANSRIVHLPSYVLAPTTSWRQGEVREERFDLELPAEIPAGSYQWRVGWYDTRSIDAATTDARSRIGDEAAVTELRLP